MWMIYTKIVALSAVYIRKAGVLFQAEYQMAQNHSMTYFFVIKDLPCDSNLCDKFQ